MSETAAERIARLEAEWEAHEREHRLLKEAGLKFEELTSERFDAYNRFREQIAEERGRFVPRETYEERHKALEDKTDLYHQQFTIHEAQQNTTIAILQFIGFGALVTALLALIGLVLRIANILQ